MPRVLSTELSGLLQGNAFSLADLYEIDLEGTTYRLTNSDTDLGSYVSTHVEWARIRSSDGLLVDDLDVTIHHDGSTTLAGVSWTRLGLDGRLDTVPVRLYRAYLHPSTRAVVGSVFLFGGEIADIDPGSTETRLVVSVPTKRFGQTFPSTAWAQTCVHEFGGTGCGFTGTIDFSVTAGAESTKSILHVASIPGGVGAIEYFIAGTVTLGGISRMIIDAALHGTAGTAGEHVTTGYAIEVGPGFPVSIPSGGTVNVQLGCLKTAQYCDAALLDNLVHFLGAPAAPVL